MCSQTHRALHSSLYMVQYVFVFSVVQHSKNVFSVVQHSKCVFSVVHHLKYVFSVVQYVTHGTMSALVFRFLLVFGFTQDAHSACVLRYLFLFFFVYLFSFFSRKTRTAHVFSAHSFLHWGGANAMAARPTWAPTSTKKNPKKKHLSSLLSPFPSPTLSTGCALINDQSKQPH